MMAQKHLIAKREIWNAPPEPVRPAPFARSYLLLLAALDGGWEVQGPVIMLNRVFPDFRSIFIFNLRRPLLDLSCRVIVDDCPQVHELIRNENLSV